MSVDEGRDDTFSLRVRHQDVVLDTRRKPMELELEVAACARTSSSHLGDGGTNLGLVVRLLLGPLLDGITSIFYYKALEETNRGGRHT